MKNAKTVSFLQALDLPEPAHVTIEAPKAPEPPKPRVSTREGKKHIGAYFDLVDDAEAIEQFARLRARLRLDNTGLMRLMIAETFRKYEAKRAFGDA